ncbi:unnamed protein product [Phaedon cochleariae]|uniref:Microtubule-associated protein Jupiter n=1 Tax=Phaedon cochleariae TaxID=80249 RepID=A0A9P0GNK8_PHACE|nr:unnamed protein product [Phaedon cochleariae]
MTSTNFNIGLGESTRNSSRVLRPPGGGHTDIFGGPDPNQGIKRDSGRNASSILEGTNSRVEPKPSSPVKAAMKIPTTTPQMSSEPEASQQSRGSRVPPGGFSSGLW